MSLILLSGPIAVGKSSIAEILIEKHNFLPIKTSPFLKDLLVSQNKTISREALQNIGDQLDIDTDYSWVNNSIIIPALKNNPNHNNWLLDSIRKKKQAEIIKNHFGSSVQHIHFHASEKTLKERYQKRTYQGGTEENSPSYETAIAHSNEQHSRSLIDIADEVINLEEIDSEQAVVIILKLISGD